MAQVANQVDLDVFGVGEHHRADFVGSAPSTMLAATAQATEKTRLTSRVTVLSSENPVRVWERFATIDLISGGRADRGTEVHRRGRGLLHRGTRLADHPLFEGRAPHRAYAPYSITELDDTGTTTIR